MIKDVGCELRTTIPGARGSRFGAWNYSIFLFLYPSFPGAWSPAPGSCCERPHPISSNVSVEIIEKADKAASAELKINQ
jgi:hypothetical protein